MVLAERGCCFTLLRLGSELGDRDLRHADAQLSRSRSPLDGPGGIEDAERGELFLDPELVDVELRRRHGRLRKKREALGPYRRTFRLGSGEAMVDLFLDSSLVAGEDVGEQPGATGMSQRALRAIVAAAFRRAKGLGGRQRGWNGRWGVEAAGNTAQPEFLLSYQGQRARRR